GFAIVADECYSELYFDESSPPLGALRAAHELGRADFANLVVLGSLSKRSSAPGLRSGYAAGNRDILERYMLYRTYEGAALSNTMQAASIAAWKDDAHVAGCGFLLLGAGARRGRPRLHPRPLRAGRHHGAAGQLHLARGAGREPGPRLRAHGAGLDGGRGGGSGGSHRGVREKLGPGLRRGDGEMSRATAK